MSEISRSFEICQVPFEFLMYQVFKPYVYWRVFAHLFPKLTSMEDALTLLFAFVWHFSLGWCETAQDFNRPKFPDEGCRSDIEDMFELINLAPEPLSDFLCLGGVWFPIEGRTEWFSTTEWLGEWWHASGWEQFIFTILQLSRPPPIKGTHNFES